MDEQKQGIARTVYDITGYLLSQPLSVQQFDKVVQLITHYRNEAAQVLDHTTMLSFDDVNQNSNGIASQYTFQELMNLISSYDISEEMKKIVITEYIANLAMESNYYSVATNENISFDGVFTPSKNTLEDYKLYLLLSNQNVIDRMIIYGQTNLLATQFSHDMQVSGNYGYQEEAFIIQTLQEGKILTKHEFISFMNKLSPETRKQYLLSMSNVYIKKMTKEELVSLNLTEEQQAQLLASTNHNISNLEINPEQKVEVEKVKEELKLDQLHSIEKNNTEYVVIENYFYEIVGNQTPRERIESIINDLISLQEKSGVIHAEEIQEDITDHMIGSEANKTLGGIDILQEINKDSILPHAMNDLVALNKDIKINTDLGVALSADGKIYSAEEIDGKVALVEKNANENNQINKVHDVDEHDRKTEDEFVERMRKSGVPSEVIDLYFKSPEKEREEIRTLYHIDALGNAIPEKEPILDQTKEINQVNLDGNAIIVNSAFLFLLIAAMKKAKLDGTGSAFTYGIPDAFNPTKSNDIGNTNSKGHQKVFKTPTAIVMNSDGGYVGALIITFLAGLLGGAIGMGILMLAR